MSDLQAQLDEISAGIPPEIGSRIDAGIAELDSAQVALGLAVGASAPLFALPGVDGTPVSLEALLTAGPVVVTFYRGDWCPFCNLQLRALQNSLGEIRAAGATLVAISAQSPDHGGGLVDKHELAFPVLSDLDQSVSEAYGVRFDLSGELEDLQVNVFQNDPADQNADGRRSLPVASTFIVDTEGTIRFSSVESDWRKRVEPADVVAALNAL